MKSIEKLLRQTEVDLQRYLYEEEKLTYSFYSIFNINEDFEYEINDKEIENYRISTNDFNVSSGFENEDEYATDKRVVTILEEIREYHKEDYLSGKKELEWYNEKILETEYKIEKLKSLLNVKENG